MERIGVYFKIKPGAQEEYKRRHDLIRPEMTEALNRAGIHNYSIWNHQEMLFAYYEVHDFENAQKILQQNQIYNQWRKYMEDIIDTDCVTGEKEYILRQMFFHAGR